MPPLEGTIRRAVIKELRRRGVYHIPYPAGPYARRGVPDLLACIGGRFVGLELKRPGAEPSPHQLLEHGRIEAAGGSVFVVRSVADLVQIGLE